MTDLRILVTGSRDWTNRHAVLTAIKAVVASSGRTMTDNDVTIVHGAARGADSLGSSVAFEFAYSDEPHPARDFPDPKVRNQHMVDLGADICLTFATRWASGTGHCARAARRAGIPTFDKGIDTRIGARP